MKVLKSGIKVAWPQQITCPRCGAELEVEKEDVRFRHSPRFSVECPECGTAIHIDSSPELVAEEANREAVALLQEEVRRNEEKRRVAEKASPA